MTIDSPRMPLVRALAAGFALIALGACASAVGPDAVSRTTISEPAPRNAAANFDDPPTAPVQSAPAEDPSEQPLPALTPPARRDEAAEKVGKTSTLPTGEASTSTPATVPTRAVPPTPVPEVAPAATPAATAPPSPPPALRGPQATTHLLRMTAAEMPLGASQGVARVEEGVQLDQQPDGTYLAEGSLLSEQHRAESPFDDVVLSWNADAPPGTRLEFQVRVGDGSSASPWFTMGTWGPSGGSSSARQGNSWGAVDIDTLELSRLANWLQYRVLFSATDRMATPRLRSLAVVYSDMSKPLAGPNPALVDGWARDLPVPQHSQLEQDPAVARSICSPTSVAMVLGYWGKPLGVKQVYQSVRDARSGIFGNWPLNTAYAGTLGFEAWVDRFFSVEQIQNEVAQGRPVIVSVRFGPGQLDNSPIASTTGHLIVVRGFTPQGDFIVNDSMAPGSGTVRRVYKREQFGKIWQDSGGTVYLIRPR